MFSPEDPGGDLTSRLIEWGTEVQPERYVLFQDAKTFFGAGTEHQVPIPRTRSFFTGVGAYQVDQTGNIRTSL